ncbi:uncharacterized protein IL334_000399 [Kwoniella shivajii]|uniref:feruloyl esterase n=1 Tax=Kwoniella shivajii TaxID=564305 RepID=A0ABZ1CQ37_9TREE|nr:hypothetical protein IL334_000399 [Kwoniella shivajii]
MLFDFFTLLSLAFAGKEISQDAQTSFQISPLTGHIQRTLPSGRQFLLNVPEGYKHDVAHPLVLAFHGAGGYSLKMERITQLSYPELRIAGLPLLAVYPQGVNNTNWNMTHIWQAAPYGNKSVDDIQFVKDIIADVEANYTIDARRRYACGKSNGGGFTARLACEPSTSSLFAAFAPVSPALYQEAYSFHGCKPSRPVPIFHAHGIEDTITPFYGRTPEEGSFGPEPDVRIWRARWAQRNLKLASKVDQLNIKTKLPDADTISYPHVNATEEIWNKGKGQLEIRALSIEGLGHAWPSTEGLDLAGSPNETATFNFTSPHLIDFFSTHELPVEYL